MYPIIHDHLWIEGYFTNVVAEKSDTAPSTRISVHSNVIQNSYYLIVPLYKYWPNIGMAQVNKPILLCKIVNGFSIAFMG